MKFRIPCACVNVLFVEWLTRSPEAGSGPRPPGRSPGAEFSCFSSVVAALVDDYIFNKIWELLQLVSIQKFSFETFFLPVRKGSSERFPHPKSGMRSYGHRRLVSLFRLDLFFDVFFCQLVLLRNSVFFFTVARERVRSHCDLSAL